MKATRTNDAKVVLDFVRTHIFDRFGIPKTIISDHGTHFCNHCCDVAVAQINYPSFKHNTQDSIEQARGRSHEEDSNQIFMLDDMQFGGGLDVI